MSNFKSNNKFDVFNKQREKEPEYDNKPKYNQFKSYSNSSTPVPVKKDFEMVEDAFPELSKQVKTTINPNNIKSKSFASLLENEEIKEEIKEIKEDIIIPPGWSYYKYTKSKNGICGDTCLNVTTKIQKPDIPINYEIVKEKTELNHLNEAEEIILALSLLHEKRTKKYKELWGESEWEEMFTCPNYDFEYFDKLDEAYEIDQYKLNEQYYNNEDDDDYY
jgi:hypothetical protein